MCWRRTAVSRDFSQLGWQTLACMKSTCNGQFPMTASRRFVFIGFLLPHWVPPHDAAVHRPAHDVHGMPVLRWGVSAGIAVLTFLGNFRYNSLVGERMPVCPPDRSPTSFSFEMRYFPMHTKEVSELRRRWQAEKKRREAHLRLLCECQRGDCHRPGRAPVPHAPGGGGAVFLPAEKGPVRQAGKEPA